MPGVGGEKEVHRAYAMGGTTGNTLGSVRTAIDTIKKMDRLFVCMLLWARLLVGLVYYM